MGYCFLGTLTKNQRRRLYDQQASQIPTFSEYEKEAPREIPVFVFERSG